MKPTGFWSYSTSDEKNSRGRLSQLRALLASEMQSQIGKNEKVNIFQDGAAIPPGAQWERQIREELEASSFFIPILTPAFLQSEWCCREVTLFGQREAALGRDDLIFPILYIDFGHEDDDQSVECHDEEVLPLLKRRQWFDFRRLRFKNYDSEEIMSKLEAIAKAIKSGLRKPAMAQQPIRERQPTPLLRSKGEGEDAPQNRETAEESRAAAVSLFGRPPTSSHRLDPSRLRDFATFREAPFAPEMVVLPSGEFAMGSDVGNAELGKDDKAWEDEIVPDKGKRRMRIPRRFAMGRTPVTFEEYDVFTDERRAKRARDGGWGRDRRPVIKVSWNDAQAYVDWLNGKLGVKAYGLPSETEWEYACRAGTNTRRWWGDAWDVSRANGARSFEGGRTSPVDQFRPNPCGRTSPVDQFRPNPWGLHDMIGNVWEWCADGWAGNIAKLPDDGAAFGEAPVDGPLKQVKTVKGNGNLANRTLRGGSWGDDPRNLRSAVRNCFEPDSRGDNIGFRLSRTL